MQYCVKKIRLTEKLISEKSFQTFVEEFSSFKETACNTDDDHVTDISGSYFQAESNIHLSSLNFFTLPQYDEDGKPIKRVVEDGNEWQLLKTETVYKMEGQ